MTSLQPIIADTGLAVSRIEPVAGGDINTAYCLHTKEKRFFLKLNDALLYPSMFQKEAAGLNALKENSSIVVPAVIKAGIVDQQQYLLLEWIENGEPTIDCWTGFGTSLALMHQVPQPYYGWVEDNYIGTLQQQNNQHKNWSSFYAECRILPLMQQMFDLKKIERKDVLLAEQLCAKLPLLFPDEPAALLHGDLWSGNFMVSANGTAAFYDPAVYFGHREMDIGMTKLFGGFDRQVYEAYNQTYPLEKGWQQRLPITQLYPLLVHALLFGGHYVSKVNEIIKAYS